MNYAGWFKFKLKHFFTVFSEIQLMLAFSNSNKWEIISKFGVSNRSIIISKSKSSWITIYLLGKLLENKKIIIYVLKSPGNNEVSFKFSLTIFQLSLPN